MAMLPFRPTYATEYEWDILTATPEINRGLPLSRAKQSIQAIHSNSTDSCLRILTTEWRIKQTQTLDIPRRSNTA
jgi:hypothetical protein